MATLADRLTLAIKRRGYTVAQVAKGLTDSGNSITRAYIYQLMRGAQLNPSLAVLQALSRHLQVSIGWLVGEDEVDSGVLAGLKHRAANVGRDLADLSDDSLDQVHGVVELARRAEGLRPRPTILPLPPPAPQLSQRQATVLAGRLRALRQSTFKSIEQVETILQHEVDLGSIEENKAALAPPTVERLLSVYGIDERHQRDCVMTIARGEREPGRFDDPKVPLWLSATVNLEQRSTLICSYNVQFVPTLLQTEEYSRAAVTAAGQVPRQAELIEVGVQFVMARQDVLSTATVWTIVDETALLRPIGGLDVQLRQVEALIMHAKQPNITVQIMRLDESAFVPRVGPFTIFRFPEPFAPEVACLHAAESDVLFTGQRGVETYKVTFEKLAVTAPSIQGATVDFLQGLRETLAQALD